MTGLDICRKATGRLGHIGAMECTRHRDLHGATASLFYQDVEGPQRLGRSGNNRLLRAVVIDRPAVLAGLFCQALDLRRIEFHDGTHAAGVTLGRHGHQCRALTYELKTRSRIECPRKGECSDLAQRESRTGGRHHAALAQGDGDSQVVHEHARLRVLGLRELLLGGAPALSARPRAHLVGNGEHLGSRRRCFDEVDAHRGMLGTLTGKQKRYATHADAPFRTYSAPSTRSSTISRALWRSLTMPAICPHKYEPSS